MIDKYYILMIIAMIMMVEAKSQPFSLDESWSTGEYPGYDSRVRGIILEKDVDRILYWGSAWPFEPFSIARYHFGSGVLDVVISTSPSSPVDIQKLPDSGYIISSGPMIKYHSDGSKDTIFSNNLQATAPNLTTRGGGFRMYVYPDGRLLAGCGYPCLGLWHKPDEHQAPFRILPDGKVDSTFTISSNGGVSGSYAYNDSLIMVYGLFMEYDDVPMFAIARIDTAGVLDTTFQSPFVFPTIAAVYFIDDDGKIMVAGSCYLPDNDTIYALVRLNPDGSVDESFKKVPERLTLPGVGIFDVHQTPDGGYLLVGEFNDIHGQPRGNIAKLNPNGSLDEAYFTGQGLVYDTADLSAWTYALRIVYDEEEDHYYIIGPRFSYFDGQKVPRVMRLRGLISGTRQPEITRHSFTLYPNPATSTVSLQLPEHIPRPERIQVAVYNTIGQQVLSQAWPTSGQMDVQHLSPGMYFVHLQHEEVLFQPQKLVVAR